MTDPRPIPLRPRRRRSGRLVAFATGLAVGLAAAGGSSWALNRYVVDHVQISDVTSYEAAHSCAAQNRASLARRAARAVITKNSYTNGLTSITIDRRVTGTGEDTVTSFLADISVSDATELRSGFAQNKFGNNIISRTSVIARNAGAVFAINGDYYGFRDTGILVRNGIVYRDKGARQGLAIYRDGTMRLYDETTTDAARLVGDGVWNTLSFGPGLVQDGRILPGIDAIEIDTNFGNHTIQGHHPRTGIGMISKNRFVMIVVDGRSPGYSRGVTMPEFAQMFVDAGAVLAYNLDGGGSATMYFDGALVNRPHDQNDTPRERGTSDILYIPR